MLKLMHKRHLGKNPKAASFIIYYNLNDIILGFLLVTLVGFFIYNYLELNLYSDSDMAAPIGSSTPPILNINHHNYGTKK